MDTQFRSDFEKVINEIEITGNDYAEKKAQSWQAQELKGAVLASLINKSGEKSLARAEVFAKAHEDYLQYLEETKEAIRKELRAKALFEKSRAKFEAMRSLSSLEKSTRNLVE